MNWNNIVVLLIAVGISMLSTWGIMSILPLYPLPSAVIGMLIGFPIGMKVHTMLSKK